MSRDDEVARLVKDVKEAFEGDARIFPAAHKSLDRLASLAREAVPSSYVPREQVTEGWWSCLFIYREERSVVWVTRDEHGRMSVETHGTDLLYSLNDFTDFLRVPSWLVEGIEKGENDATR